MDTPRGSVETVHVDAESPPLAPPPGDARSHGASAALTACWLVCASVGLFQASAMRHNVNPDGMSYLESAEHFAAGDWGGSVNAYWSPLLPWLLGQVGRWVRPDAYWEATAAHLALFAVFLASGAAFEFFRRELTHRVRWLADPVAIVVGYALFLWSAIALIGLARITPDQCVAAVIYTASGLLLRIRSRRGGWGAYMLLGLTLGLGYWAKAAMFPIALVFLATAGIAASGLDRAPGWRAVMRTPLPRLACAAVVFGALAAPLVATLSAEKGRVTFGDAGALAYAWYVDGWPYWWVGDEPGSGTPKHPVRRVASAPPVYEFPAGGQGAYPLWYDPSYWDDGMTPRFVLGRQLVKLRRNLLEDWTVFGVVLLLASLPLWITSDARGAVRALAGLAFLWLPSVAVVGMYSAVHVEARFLGASVVVLCMALMAAVYAPTPDEARRLVGRVGVAMLIPILFSMVPPLLEASKSLRAQSTTGRRAHRHWAVAQDLAAGGLRPGDRVGSVGFTFGAYWARLARLRIAAEAPSIALPAELPNACCASGDELGRAIAALRTTGVRAVIIDDTVLGGAARVGRPVGDGSFRVVMLDR